MSWMQVAAGVSSHTPGSVFLRPIVNSVFFSKVWIFALSCRQWIMFLLRRVHNSATVHCTISWLAVHASQVFDHPFTYCFPVNCNAVQNDGLPASPLSLFNTAAVIFSGLCELCMSGTSA